MPETDYLIEIEKLKQDTIFKKELLKELQEMFKILK